MLVAGGTLSACQTAEKHKAAVQPPAKVIAPDPLPLPSFDSLLRSSSIRIPDAIDLLVARAESLYAAGMEDYRVGNLEKAKDEFDQALGILLESKLDLEADDRLSAEFNKLVEDIHAVELAALERGDTLAGHNYEPAPIESLAGLTFPVDPKVKQQVQREVQSVRSDLPLVSNDYVAGVINYFQSQKRGQGFIRNILKRVGLYQSMIAEALRKEGLPEDLIYVAAAESAFNPFALSRAGAKGIWQLMLGRALEYGLKKDRWVDEREDPEKSTLAAIRHLKDLYQQFGDWPLAIAAYNAGPGNIQKAIERTGYADFWTLRKLGALPRETENYVPIILATAIISKDPLAFGFDVQPEPAPVADQVVVNVPTDLRLVAQIIDRPVEELIRLNPSLLRWTTPANDPKFVLNLPPATKETYEQGVASIPPDKRIWWRAHKVEQGETLSSISKKFRISSVTLAEANHVERSRRLEEGARLVIPMAPGNESSLTRVRERGPRRPYRYRVRPGDTLELIADRFDVTPYQIRRWNNLKTSRLVAGKTLMVYIVGGGGGRSYRHHRRRRGSAGSTRATQKASPSRDRLARKGRKAAPKASKSKALASR